MLVPADIIYPAFVHPYVVQVLMPVVGVAALVLEIVVYRVFYRDAGLVGLSLVVIAANVASSLAGVLLAHVLPSGLNSAFLEHSTGPAKGPHWNTLAFLAWPVAWGLSVAIEYPIIAVAMRRRTRPRLFRAVCVANAASYAMLVVALEIGVWHLWS